MFLEKLFSFILLFFLLQSAEAGILNIPLKNKFVFDEHKQIEICWLAKDNSLTRPLQIEIESFLQQQLEKRAGFSIQFHSRCLTAQNPLDPIGILFYDGLDNPPGLMEEAISVTSYMEFPGHPRTYSRGLWTKKNLTDIVLTSQFKNVQPSLVEQSHGLSTLGQKNLLVSIALHEMLHALGIDHEQVRPDSTCNDESGSFNLQIHTLVGAYDPESVMNYCKTHVYDFEKGPIELSEGDLETLRFLSQF